MTLHMSLPPPRSTEAQLTVRALERLCPCMQAHVHLQTSFCGEGIAADMTAEQLLAYKNTSKNQPKLIETFY